MRGLVVACALAGCADFAGIGDPAPLAPDAPAPPCKFDNIDLCLYASPQNDLALDDDLMLNTDRDCDLVYNNPIGRSACVLYAKTITISANITPRGARPLILAATDSIEVTGTVDLSAYFMSNFNFLEPASANDRDCVGATIDAAGPGGSFHGKGGDGGASAGGAVATAAPAISLPGFLRGGCGGSVRGSGQGGADEGVSTSPSGGAVALVAGNRITVTTAGKILANGAGGIGGVDTIVGGGGGGSGGMIKLVAATISILGVVTANGGGGGEGADGTTNGTPGANGTGTAMAAAGGSGHAGGGDGGAGGAGMTVNGTAGTNVPSADTDADGGGGGGAGFVAISGELTGGGTISPSPTAIQ